MLRRVKEFLLRQVESRNVARCQQNVAVPNAPVQCHQCLQYLQCLVAAWHCVTAARCALSTCALGRKNPSLRQLDFVQLSLGELSNQEVRGLASSIYFRSFANILLAFCLHSLEAAPASKTDANFAEFSTPNLWDLGDLGVYVCGLWVAMDLGTRRQRW